MSGAVGYLAWMTGSAWISAASAGLAVVVQNSLLRWLFVFGAVFNGLFTVYCAMKTVYAGYNSGVAERLNVKT
jgi:hypothetical protein